MNICTDLNTRYTRLNENTRKLVKKPQSKKLINNEYKKDTLSKAESKLQDDKFQTPFSSTCCALYKNRIKFSIVPQSLEIL